MTEDDKVNDFTCAACGKELKSGDDTAFRERKILHLECAIPCVQPPSDKQAA